MELQIAFDCERYHCLPEAGGMRQQPAKLMLMMRSAMNVYNAMIDYKANGHKAGGMRKWAESNPGYADIVDLVKRLRNAR